LDFKENMTELTEQTTKTLDQHAAELDAWLKARGLVPVVVMQGIDTGHISPIADGHLSGIRASEQGAHCRRLRSPCSMHLLAKLDWSA
jgi:phage gp36-like protein